ncbi:hypothetical protein QTP70_016035 [Hemibagrus guttatus]|uniref:RRM domain-containing protein n=1 Tax=Hemibagrus guttatus TaxID=175788 RepID=A0AAE0V3Z9_9TELE|nr:hypothetical protein QTP70_016035 [Hemibagrus guttatus]
MSRHSRHGGETKVYVGNLGTGAGKGELERAFSYYGPLRTVWIARNPPGFAFVEFDDPRDAEDAVRGLDGKVICGTRVRVELSTGMPRRSRYDRPPTRRPFDPNDRCYECESVLKVFSFSLHPFIHAAISVPFRVDRAGLALAHALAEGGIPVPTLAAGAEAGGRGPSLLTALALALRGSPGPAHPEGPGLDHDPDLTLALPLIRGADPALLGDPGLDLQPGVTVTLLLKPLAEARAQIVTTEDPLAVFVFVFFLFFFLSFSFSLSRFVCISVWN